MDASLNLGAGKPGYPRRIVINSRCILSDSGSSGKSIAQPLYALFKKKKTTCHYIC